MLTNRSILSVKDLNQMVKDLLTDAIGQIRLVGEISNFSKPASGHWYFTLKDNSAQVRCAMFRNSNFKTGFIPKDGQQVLVSAAVTLYEARGEYQLVIDKLQLAGTGLLQQKFEQLKKKLQEEGLFDSAYKQAIPKDINTIGIVTSSTGAALHDICQILKRRDPSLRIIIYPTLVQGEEAAAKITKMIELANIRSECDVLIVGRGGGSLEDLWPFNEECVARAIFNSKLPIISAVGHEIDFTIADFVADLRAATPSAAAELISRDTQDQLKDLRGLEQQIAMAMDNFLLKKNDQLQKLRHHLQTQHPQVKLAKQQTYLLAQSRSLNAAMEQIMLNQRNQLSQLNNRLSRQSPENKIQFYRQIASQKQQELNTLAKQYLTHAKHQIAIQASQLNAVSPLGTLERGYSVTTDSQNNIVRSIKQLKPGDTIATKVSTGTITSTIITTTKNH
ncbi:exodeoxyribonuclease VII large subunit [Orbus hercynius]|uniref:Exodeoxyribonuclease 7 large subunit n=1 Tax=Orbus hercynius TaxID=593135 RepID=A0A495RAN2_9GAMM|nr:exodeoxyribonuclease VII large subunit [Orbus hercynius]RKS84532.1 exodeoxyribonuclease VII large subunit [Orbus hercynius]